MVKEEEDPQELEEDRCGFNLHPPPETVTCKAEGQSSRKADPGKQGFPLSTPNPSPLEPGKDPVSNPHDHQENPPFPCGNDVEGKEGIPPGREKPCLGKEDDRPKGEPEEEEEKSGQEEKTGEGGDHRRILGTIWIAKEIPPSQRRRAEAPRLLWIQGEG
jgi:hypothetical protein